MALAICSWQEGPLLAVANGPLAGRPTLTLAVVEPFTTTLAVAAHAALLLTLPVLLYELYAYVLPAFTLRERRVALPILLAMPLLFLVGVMFGYFVVVPAAPRFLLHFNSQQFKIQIRARDYYGFLSSLLLAVGLVFQAPMVVPARRWWC